MNDFRHLAGIINDGQWVAVRTQGAAGRSIFSYPVVVALRRATRGEMMTAPAAPARYPVRLRGEYGESLSRWLWLIKWILAIPHYIILVFLAIAFLVLSTVAGVAILITARYPRRLFDFNVGVMRWSWRVRFYAYAALGTDKYPPFTLRSTDYPAELEIDYPERLSRGLVLIKWWLLAIPHYLILAALLTGTVGFLYGSDPNNVRGTVSLLGLLVLFGAVALLLTGRYPRGLFDFVVGINRWLYRLWAYTALLRDDYPPFRLDQGPHEPADPRPTAPGPPTDPSSAIETR